MGDFIKQSDINLPAALLANLTGSSDSTPVKEVFNKILNQTEGLVKAFLGVKFDIELADELKTAALIVWVNDIFEYRLYKYSNKAVPEAVMLSYDEAKKELEKVGTGMLTIGAETDDEAAARDSKSTSWARG